VRGFILAGEKEISSSSIYFISSEFTTGVMLAKSLKTAGQKTVKFTIPHFAVKTTAFFSQVFGFFSSKPVVLNIEKSRELTQRYWICSIEKAKRELGFKESFTLEAGFKDTIEWYRKEGWLKPGKSV
jgi:nucleoside-diphosphate-sugar epimerase